MKNSIKMKKLFAIFLVTLLITFGVLSNFYYAFSKDDDENSIDSIEVSAGASILLDNKTNKVLYSKNENKKMYPASTTKILTAIIVLENSNLEDVVTASYNAVVSIPDGYSTANIQIGEELTVQQLLELLLVHSANDAANVLAEHVGGSVDSFVSMMNTKLNELDLNGSHFTNTFGMHDDNHYTTAHDLASIMQYCLKNENFRKFAGQASCAIPATNKYGTRSYTSTNDLIVPTAKNYYKYLTAGKTGTTTQAKQCLVSSAYNNDLELICVVLGSTARFSDTRTLYEYGYSNFSVKNIVNEKDVIANVSVKHATNKTKSLDLVIDSTVSALVNNSYDISKITPEINLNENISAPVDEGQTLGTVKYTADGIDYTANLVASHSVEKSKILYYILFSIAIIVVLFILYRILFYKKKRSKKKVKYIMR